MRDGQFSKTARGAAAYRAIHQTLDDGAIFRDPLAARILDEKTAAALSEIAADESLRPIRLFIAARSRFSEDTIANCVTRGVRQGVRDGRKFGTFTGARVQFVAAAGFDQDGVIAGADHVAVETERDAVEFVGGSLAAPEGLGDNPEHDAAVPPVDGIADKGQFKIAHLCGG